MANIANRTNNTVISGTSGADSISNSGTNVTINGWSGNDSVSLNGGANISINAGKGNDRIYNNSYYDDDDWRLGVDSVTIDGGDGYDYIYNMGSNVSVNGGDGNDSIDSFGKNEKSTLHGGAGSDSIDNNGYLTTIDGGADDDYITNSGEAVSINGGTGNDSINNWGVSTSIEGGKGNDTIINSEKVYHNEDNSSGSYDGGSNYVDDDNSGVGMVYIYRDGDGNDLVQGFNENDTVFIADGTWSTAKSGNNVIVTVGDGKITLRGAASLSAVNIVSTAKDISPINIIKNNTAKTLITGTKYRDSIVNGSLWNNECSSSTIISGDGNDTIENWGSFSSINCGTGNDYVYIPSDIWYLSGAQIKFANGVSIEGGKGNDTLESYGSGTVYIYNNGDGNDSIVGFNESDTLLIASGTWSTAKSGNNVIVTVGDGKITLRGAASLSAVNVVSSVENVHPVTFISNSRANTLIMGTSYKDSIYNDKASNVTINGGADDDTLRNVGGSNVSIDGGDGDDIIESYLPTYGGGRVDTDFLSCKNVTINGGAGSDYIFNDINKTSISGGAGNDFIDNSGDNVTIDGGSGNDTIENWFGRNSSIIGGKGDDLISLGSYAENALIKYASGDGNDLIEGFNNTSTLQIVGSYSSTKSGSDIIVTVDDGSITLQGAASLSAVHIDGKQATKTLTLKDSNSDKITLPGAYTSADASARKVGIQITGNALDNSIVGGKAADTLAGGTGNDTLTGGWGADTFVYTGGNDVITDYAANFDKVSIAGDGAKYLSHITGVDVSNSDVKLTFSKDNKKTLTLNGAAGKKIIINGVTRIFSDNVISTGDKKYATLTGGFGGTFNANGYKGVNASAVTQAVTISGANSIVGGAKADSITGTTGNDTLTGGYGADTFVYTGGKDVITDYAANFDKISLAGGNNAKWLSHITGVAVKNNDVTLTFGNDANKTLTLNNAAGKKVIINGATRIFEDGKIYTADKSKSTVASAADGYWFDEHDFTQGAQLDSLMETSTNYSIGKLDAANNLTKLTQDEFILTYGDEK